jgi:hypothetical protein
MPATVLPNPGNGDRRQRGADMNPEVRQLAPFSAIFGFENAFKSMGKLGRVKTLVLAN